MHRSQSLMDQSTSGLDVVVSSSSICKFCGEKRKHGFAAGPRSDTKKKSNSILLNGKMGIFNMLFASFYRHSTIQIT